MIENIPTFTIWVHESLARKCSHLLLLSNLLAAAARTDFPQYPQKQALLVYCPFVTEGHRSANPWAKAEEIPSSNIKWPCKGYDKFSEW